MAELGLDFIEQRAQAGHQGVADVVGHGQVQAFFVAKVIGNGRNVLTGQLGDLAGGGAGQAVFTKHLHPSADQSGTGHGAAP